MSDLRHSAKGSSWKDHKYFKKEGTRYFYSKPQDLVKGKTIEETNEDVNAIKNKRETFNEAIAENDDFLSKAYTTVHNFLHTPIRELLSSNEEEKIQNEYETAKEKYFKHSTGDWERHKYISKDEDNEHYKYSKEQMAIYESHRDEKESEEKELSEEEKARLEGEKKFEEKAKTAGTSTSDSSKKKSGSSSKSKQPKSVADMIKTSGKGAAAASKAKAASEKAGKSAKEKAGSTKTAKEKTTKEKTVKEQAEKFDHYTTSSTKVQKALKTYADLGKGDSITSKLDADGNWESTVTYENGDTQTFVMDKKYKILKTGERKTSVQHAMELANDFLIQNGFDEDEEFLEHNGIKGQKWGVKNGPPYPIPAGDHSAAEKKANKYRNIDGSLNEKGIDHKRKYVEKSINKNNRKYQKYIDKYDKKIEKAEDKETKDYYISRKKNAIATRDAVNKYFKEMGIDEIAEQEQMYKEKALKTAGIVAGAAGSVALGLGAPMLIASGAKSAATFLAKLDPKATVESLYGLAETPFGQKAVAATDSAIRAYSDMRAYAFSIYADQTITRLRQSGVVDKAGALTKDVVGSAVTVPTVKLDTTAAQASVNELINAYDLTKLKHSEDEN